MTRAEYDQLPSNRKEACPDCGLRTTKPYPNCRCPYVETNHPGIGFTQHVNKFHHDCEYSRLHETCGDSKPARHATPIGVTETLAHLSRGAA